MALQQKERSCAIQAVKPWPSFWQKLLPLRSFLIPADNVLWSTVAGVSRTIGNIGENRDDSGGATPFPSSLLPRRLPLNLPILYVGRLLQWQSTRPNNFLTSSFFTSGDCNSDKTHGQITF